MSSSWSFPVNLHLRLYLGYPQPRGLQKQRKQAIFECPPFRERRTRHKGLVILKEKQAESYKANNAKDKRMANKDSKHTAGKGCSESKFLAAKSAIW
jgi:hypothetical protein